MVTPEKLSLLHFREGTKEAHSPVDFTKPHSAVKQIIGSLFGQCDLYLVTQFHSLSSLSAPEKPFSEGQQES